MADRTRHFSVFFAAAGVQTETVWRPAVDVFRTCAGTWVLKFELAGVRLEDIEIVVQGRRLTVRGLRRDLTKETGAVHYAMELEYGRFERSVELPCDLQSMGWELEYTNGILTVRLDRRG